MGTAFADLIADVATSPARVMMAMPGGAVQPLRAGTIHNVFVQEGWVHVESRGIWTSYPAERILSVEWIRSEDAS